MQKLCKSCLIFETVDMSIVVLIYLLEAENNPAFFHLNNLLSILDETWKHSTLSLSTRMDMDQPYVPLLHHQISQTAVKIVKSTRSFSTEFQQLTSLYQFQFQFSIERLSSTDYVIKRDERKGEVNRKCGNDVGAENTWVDLSDSYFQ